MEKNREKFTFTKSIRKSGTVFRLLIFVSLLLLTFACSTSKGVSKEGTDITREDVMRRASDFAKQDPHGRFSDPYLDSVTRVEEVWVVKILSGEPSMKVDGGYYLYMTIDSRSGDILASTVGGGS